MIPIELLGGDDEYRVRSAVLRKVESVAPDVALGSLFRFDGAGLDLDRLIEALTTPALFSPDVMVVVANADAVPSALTDGISRALAERTATARVILTTNKNPDVIAKRYLSKGDREKALVTRFDKLNEQAGAAWIRDLVLAGGLSITSEAVALLLDRVGPDNSGGLAAEVSKYVSILGAGAEVDADSVARYTPITREAEVFRFVDAVAYRRLRQAVDGLESLTRRVDREVPGLVVLLAGHLAKVRVTLASVEQRKPIPPSVDPNGRRGWLFKKQADAWTGAELDDALLHLATVDRTIKTGGRAYPALESFLLLHLNR